MESICCAFLLYLILAEFTQKSVRGETQRRDFHANRGIIERDTPGRVNSDGSEFVCARTVVMCAERITHAEMPGTRVA